MCDCTGCKFTDSHKSFAAWPKGEPKGAAKAKAEYAAHWNRCGAESDSHAGYHFLNAPAAKYVAVFLKVNNLTGAA